MSEALHVRRMRSRYSVYGGGISLLAMLALSLRASAVSAPSTLSQEKSQAAHAAAVHSVPACPVDLRSDKVGIVIDDHGNGFTTASYYPLEPKPARIPPSWLKRNLSRVSGTPAKPRGIGAARKRSIVGVKKRRRKSR